MENKEQEEKVENSTPEAVPAEETKSGEENLEANKEQPKEEVEESPYKEELEKVKSKLSKAEYKLTEENKEKRALKKAIEENNPGLSEEDVQERVSQEVDKLRSEMTVSQIESELSKISNPEERELTEIYYKEKLNHSGITPAAIAEDVANARMLANKRKYQQRESEILKAAEAEKAKARDGATGEGTENEKPSNLSDREKAILERSGVSPENVGKDISELLNK